MTTNSFCPVCEDHAHLYTKAEFRIDGGAWSHTGVIDNVECTSCDTLFEADEIDVPDLPGFLTVPTMERLEAFLCGFEDDDEQEGVADMLRDLRTALGIKRGTDFSQDDMGREITCSACGREESECSAEPCDDVIAERKA